MSWKLTSEQNKQIREEVKNGKVKYTIAKENGISYQLVYYYTKDLPSSRPGNRGIGVKSLELLKLLLNQGYIESTRNCYQNLRTLKKQFPMIQIARVDHKCFYFINDKNKVALKAMLETRKSKVISYHDLARVTKVFNVNLSPIEKNKLRGIKKKSVMPIIHRKDGGFMSSYMKSQSSLDDFMGNNSFFGISVHENDGKNHVFENDSHLKKSDPLVDFYIRMY